MLATLVAPDSLLLFFENIRLLFGTTKLRTVKSVLLLRYAECAVVSSANDKHTREGSLGLHSGCFRV